jgi:PleD family two-component response regulator
LIAEKLRHTVASKDISTENTRFNQTISIGLSTLNDNDKSLFEIQKRAD